MVDFDFPLPLGREGEFRARANKKEILEAALMLRSIADFEVEAKLQVSNSEGQAEEKKESKLLKDSYSKTTTCLKKLLQTLGIVINWLEYSCAKAEDDQTHPSPLVGDKTDSETKETVDGKQQNTPPIRKEEVVLRGLYHITELGRYTSSVGFLELASKLLDVPENWSKVKLEHIYECLNEVEKQQQKISKMVEEACDIMQEIVKDPELDSRKASAFNTTVRQANVIIESCEKILSNAEGTINELSTVMSTIKGFSRLVRLVGFAVTCYVTYHISPLESLVDYIPPVAINLLKNLVPNSGLNYAGYSATFVAVAYGWLSMFPRNLYATQDKLEELKLRHERLNLAFDRLKKRLKVANEDVRKHSSSSSGNSG